MPAVDRVLIVVFDGLRPDLIAGRMPNLEGFAAESVRFTEARSVFPSMTRVATTSLATGCWPAAHGIVNNTFHQPHVLKGEALDTSARAHLEAADRAFGGVISTRGLCERLGAAGKRMGAVHMGSAGSAFLVNHRGARWDGWTLSGFGEAASQPAEIVARAQAALGPLPDGEIPRLQAVDYADRAGRALALAEDGPDLAVVWMPEPDTSFHYRELDSAPTRAAMTAADAAFGRLLEAARSGPRGGRTAVIAMSDHGQITITGRFDLEGEMRAAGFAAAERPGPEDRIALTLGASGEVRMLDGDRTRAAEAAAWLQGREEIGMLFARDDLAAEIPGVLPLSAARLDHPRAAELVYVMRSGDGPDAHGFEGATLVSGGPPTGGGMHGGLHRRELNTTLMISAPGAAGGVADDRPCGLVDIAPTVLSLMGIGAEGMDGRALPLDGAPAPAAEEETLEAAAGGFRQRLVRRAAEGRVHLHSGGRV